MTRVNARDSAETRTDQILKNGFTPAFFTELCVPVTQNRSSYHLRP